MQEETWWPNLIFVLVAPYLPLILAHLLVFFYRQDDFLKKYELAEFVYVFKIVF